MVQMKLYELELLVVDEKFVPGTLDELTLQAIAGFQQFMNETYGLELEVIDILDPEVVVDEETLLILKEITLEQMTPPV